MIYWLMNDPFGFMVFTLLRNLFYMVIAILVLVFLVETIFDRMNKSTGIRFSEHIYGELKKGNLAVAVYYGARVFAVVIGVSIIAAAFIK